MFNINKVFVLLAVTICTVSSHAAVTCQGTIKSVYKWNYMDRISILLDSTNKWINMPTSSDESMALMAFVAGKSVTIYWSAEDVTSCMDGWVHNRSLTGYFQVSK